MGVGRFFCVSIPFVLTIASLVFLLLAVLSVSYPLFSVNTKDFSMSITTLGSLSGLSLTDIQNLPQTEADLLSEVNVTAADLGLADSYAFYLFTFSSTIAGKTTKAATAFDYASRFNASTLAAVAESKGIEAAVPKAVNSALTVFATLIKWSEIVFIIACALGGITLLVGFIGFCSRMGSCCTYIICSMNTIASIAFGGLCTAIALIAVGAFTAFKRWGLNATLGTTFLTLIWLGVVFSVAAGLFWLFSACCCASDRKERRDKRFSVAGSEKRFSSASAPYHPVHDPFLAPGQQSGIYNGQPQHSYPLQPIPYKSTAAYEPYKTSV